jgi:hypothetical protein
VPAAAAGALLTGSGSSEPAQQAQSGIDSSGGIPKAEAGNCGTRRRGGFIGIGGDSFIHPPHADCILALQAQAGAGVIRLTFDWKKIETRRGTYDVSGTYDFSLYDAWFRVAASRNFKVLPILFGVPPFYGRQASTGSYPPGDLAAWRRFVTAVVERYGPGGSFFAENPDVPVRPLKAYQVWGEANLKQYWRPRVNAKAYTRLLKTAYQAIKRADRSAEVVTGGFPDSLQAGAVRLRPWLQQLYKAGADKYFDTLAVNLYGTNAKAVIQAMNDTRLFLNAPKVPSLIKKLFKAKPAKRASELRSLVRELPRSQRKKDVDPKAKLWLTEIGWGTGGPRHRFNIGERRQAKEITALFKGLYKLRNKLKLRGIIYFGWQDQEPYPPAFREQWGLHTGLFKRNGRPKPGYNAFKNLAPKLR